MTTPVAARSNGSGAWCRAIIGLLAGGFIAAVDNFAFGGEITPIVIVALLLVAAAVVGVVWGRRGVAAATLIWVLLPASHFAKRLLGLQDTIHPNTYASVWKLAGFSLVVTAVGFAIGLLIHAAACRSDSAAGS